MASIFQSSFFSIAGQKERLANVVGVVNAAFNPFSKSTVEANVSNPTMKTALETVANHPYVTAGVIAGGYTLATKPVIAAATGKALIPTTTKGKIITAVAAPVVIGAVAKQPAQAAKALISAPSALANVGGNVANLASNPSLENLGNLYKENPVIVGGATAAVALLTAKGLFPAIATAKQTQAIQEQTAAIEAATGQIALPTEKANYTTSPVGVSSSPTVPVTPQTQTVMAGATRKYKRKASKKVMPTSISQRVNVLVSNRNQFLTKKLIRRNVIAY